MIRSLLSAAFLANLMAVAVLVVPMLSPAVAPRHVQVRGEPAFLAGVNYPWRSPQDFGTGGWGHAGVSHPTTYAEVDTDFANLAAQGVRVVKWRVFNDGRYSPEFDAHGFVTGLDEKFFADLDAALELAHKHDLYLIFVLFSSGFWTTDCSSPQGVRFGGHADLLLNPAKRRSLVTRAVIPMLQHINDNDRVLAYEIIAEPDWGVAELHQERDWRIKVPLGPVRALVREVSSVVHTYSSALATVETNRASHLPAWRGLGLDYYSFSWYDWVEPYDPLNVPARAYQMDRPVVLGEFPANGSQYYQLQQVLEIAMQHGYGGAFAWSYWGGDRMGEWAAIVSQYLSWAREHWQTIGMGGDNRPPPTPPQLLPLPFGYDGLGLALSRRALIVELELLARDPGRYHAKLYLRPLSEQSRVEQAIPLEGGESLKARVRFPDLREGQHYQLSLGIFDEQWRLRKWYEWVANFLVRDGRIVLPELSPREREDPCATIRE